MSFPFLGWRLLSPQQTQQKRTCASATAAPVKNLGNEVRLLKWSQPPSVDRSGEKEVLREGHGGEEGATSVGLLLCIYQSLLRL